MLSSPLSFDTSGGLRLAADALGSTEHPLVLFLHGGGQTRGSWKTSLTAVAALGFHAISLDARGHGDSDWSPTGDYRLQGFADDLADVLEQLGRPAILVGASLGGITALLHAGGSGRDNVRALVLVDVAPRINPDGVARILSFMGAHPDGFESPEQAAAAIAAYNPHRRRPPTASGLSANLRRRGGRYFWHWDPAFLAHRREDRDGSVDRLEAAARHIEVPTLLVHAGRSDVVTATEIRHLQALMPHCHYRRVDGAGHMVAGDANDAFNEVITTFLTDLA